MRCIIIDMDNCLSDDRWRRAQVFNPRAADFAVGKLLAPFHGYNSLAPFDAPTTRDAFAQEILHWDNPAVVISTARPEFYFTATKEWLSRNFPELQLLNIYMRNNADDASGVEVKRKSLGRLKLDYSPEILCAYDDDRDALDMYADNGIQGKVVDIAAGIFEATA